MVGIAEILHLQLPKSSKLTILSCVGHKTRLFWILWVAGMAGVLSFLFVDVSALIAALPLPEREPVELPPPALLKLLSVLQPAVLLTLAVLVGVRLAERVGLHAPATEALASGNGFLKNLRPQIVPGVITGVAAGIAILITWIIAKPFLSGEFVTRVQEFNKFIPAAVRILYGGFTEELLLRWGVMTFLVWLAWRLMQKGKGEPKPIYFNGAIIVSALIFGLGHLPIASALAGELTVPIVIYVITGNSIFGIVAGFLYWKRGLEAAVIAHIFAHVVLITAIYFAL
ncbi:MAG: CPBP family intramembrane metalloprotease [Saprospiraceae bacterium]|nr:CPBP family intramembrane metalloprotease [Pyrinomonadaceae bacterium]